MEPKPGIDNQSSETEAKNNETELDLSKLTEEEQKEFEDAKETFNFLTRELRLPESLNSESVNEAAQTLLRLRRKIEGIEDKNPEK